jgi:hypothetical protein
MPHLRLFMAVKRDNDGLAPLLLVGRVDKGGLAPYCLAPYYYGPGGIRTRDPRLRRPVLYPS